MRSSARPAAGPAWWLVAPPALSAGLTFVALGYASRGFSSAPELGPGVTLGFVAWVLAPSAGMLALVVAAVRRGWRGRVVLLVGGLVLLAFMAWAMGAIVASESSTAALGFVFYPLYAWVPVLLTGVVLLVWNLRRGSAARP